ALNQLTSLTVGSTSFQYNYAAGQNNGQIASATISGEQVTYGYDTLKRLTSATAATWNQSFGYDGFGNLMNKTTTAGGVPTISMTVDAASNRITSAGGASFGYDLNGNVVSGPNIPNGGLGMIYDCRNRVAQAPTGGSGVAYTAYAYDAANRRVWKGTINTSNQLSAETYYLYDTDGTQLGAYTLTATVNGGTETLNLTASVNHIYFAGKHVADRSINGYVFPDNTPDRLASEMTYFPYGDEKGTPTANERVKFASYFRDTESGLDYAGNRYYSAPMARFLSPDPYKANNGGRGDLKEPQSWNRYAYVGGDPINRNDPAGTCW